MIFYHSENSIHDIRLFSPALICYCTVVKYTSSVLQQWTRNETWLPNIIEIAPLNLLDPTLLLIKRPLFLQNASGNSM